jgi:hypothetical protein
MSKKETTTVFPPVDLGEGRILTIASVQVEARQTNKGKPFVGVSFGYSIKNPEDPSVNQELGNNIAKGRALKSPFAVIGICGDRFTKKLIEDLKNVLQEDFKHRLNNYVSANTKPKV